MCRGRFFDRPRVGAAPLRVIPTGIVMPMEDIMKKILIIEDDESLSMLEKDYLETKNYNVVIKNDGLEGLNYAQNEDVDLIVLDIMLPKMDGFNVLRTLRETIDIPILLVSAKSMEIDKIKGLGFGADDYITKPFNFNEFIARVEVNLNRYDKLTSKMHKDSAKKIEYKGIVIEPETRRVYVDGVEAVLVNKEFEVLHLLAQHPNIVFSKDKIMDIVWGYDSLGDTSTVTVHINRIREKIENSRVPRYIDTVRGVGYRFKSDS